MHKRISGFGIIESMMVLAMLAAIVVGIILFTSRDAAQKDAKILSAQTEAFATMYAHYMKTKDAYTLLVQQTKAGPVTLSPSFLSSRSAWPIDLSYQNMYHQVPCVTVVRNSDSGNLEALMYYVGGSSQQTSLAINIVQKAVIWLGSKGGILVNGAVQGNSGWRLDSGSVFLSGASQCGGALSNNSLVVNLDLLSDWNQNLQPLNSLLRGQDQLSLPGSFSNANTLKSNLYFESNAGVILDSNSGNPVKLAVLYNGQGSGAPTLGLGESVSTRLISDTLQSNISFRVGDPCLEKEEGKTVADKGFTDSQNLFLSRSTLVCTQSNLLCGDSNYCYLTSVPNSITFQNISKGVQNPGGQFICPKAVPFAVSVKTGFLGGGQIYVIANTKGTVSPNSITAKLNKIIPLPPQVIHCPITGCNPGIRTDYRSGAIDGIGQLMSIDLATVESDPVGIAGGGGSPDYTPVSKNMGNYAAYIGYQVDLNPGPVSCDIVCNSLSTKLGNNWQLLGTQRKSRVWSGVSVDHQNLGCACERTDFSGANPDNYNGIAVVIGTGKPIIVSATCSNMPFYGEH